MAYRSGAGLKDALALASGAQPHDPMDRRIADSARSGLIPDLPHEQPLAWDALALDFSPTNPPPAPTDTDGDGLPDAFEAAQAHHGLRINAPDNNGTALSTPLLGVPGYTNLEVYLELLARGKTDGLYANGFEPG